MLSPPSAVSKPPARSTEPDLVRLLPWCATLLFVLYGVGVLSSMVPLQLSSPQWQLRFCEALINQIPLVLMGLSVAVVARRWEVETGLASRLLRWTSRAALPLTVGFALLIPLQGFASLQLLQAANRNSTTVIEATTRNLKLAREQINQAGSTDALEAVASQLPVRLPPMGQLGGSSTEQQQKLLQVLDQLRGRTVLQVQLNRQQQQTLLLRNSLRLGLLAVLLAWMFQQARPLPLRRAVGQTSRGRRWPRPNLLWLRRSRAGRSGSMSTDLDRYCGKFDDGLSGDVANRG